MDSKDKKYKILLTGGGTGGSVAPLLAVAEELASPPLNLPSPSLKTGAGENKGGGEFEFLWLGTKDGPERAMVASAGSVSSPRPELGTKAQQANSAQGKGAGIKFRAISGGKWRRYFSLKNLADILKIKLAFWQAFFIMLKRRPDLVMSAGSFSSVPVVWAAWLLRVPILIHQQDVQPGLANRLMAPFAKIITVTFDKSLKDYGKKAVWTGNPTRRSLIRVTRNAQRITKFKFENNLPVVLILGGGTGASAINKLVEESLGELTKFCQIIHVAGKNKLNSRYALCVTRYATYEFLDAERMAEAFNSADMVVTRAGLGFLTELSYLGKPSIIIPMPDSHQEANAEFFRNKEAAIVISQKDLTAENFTQLIKDLLADEKMKSRLALNMKNAMKPGASRELAKIINKILNFK